jgi:hypothetical protein
VWNGSRYEFISDIIGPGILGEWVSPGERNTSDPTEYLKVDGNLVKPRNGRLSFKFAEAMEEITYLDQVRLVAIDHPPTSWFIRTSILRASRRFPNSRLSSAETRGRHWPHATITGAMYFRNF